MKKFFVIFIPVSIMIISVLIMLSGSFLKKPLLGWDNVPKHMDTITQAVTEENWSVAEQDTKELEKAWTAVVKRVQFSLERDEMNAFSVSIARLKAAIATNDKSSAMMELYEAGQHWEDLGR